MPILSLRLTIQARRDALYVQCDGFTFVGCIVHDAETNLLAMRGRAPPPRPAPCHRPALLCRSDDDHPF